MAESVIQICNLALAHATAEGAIEDLDPELGEEERQCSLFYNPLRKQLLSGHPWSFATKQVALTLTTATPIDTRWTYAYQYPVDCLRFRHIINTADPDKKVPYKIIQTVDDGTLIVTNAEDALAEYIIDVEDVTKFDDLFTMTLSYWIAAHIAKPLTGSSAARNDALQMYQSLHPGAKAKDANEEVDPPEEQASWIEARA